MADIVSSSTQAATRERDRRAAMDHMTVGRL
jgi:hypothetical protein